MYNFIPLIAAGALPFSVARPDEIRSDGQKSTNAEAARRDHECL